MIEAVKLVTAFALTVVIEGAAMLLATKNKKDVYYSFLANLATNPALNALCLFVNFLTRSTIVYAVVLAVLETVAVFVESRIYTYLGVFKGKKSLVMSLLFNLASLVLGIFIMGLVFYA